MEWNITFGLEGENRAKCIWQGTKEKSRARWSQGNVLAKRSKVRVFKPGWSRWIFSGHNNPEDKSSKCCLPSNDAVHRRENIYRACVWSFKVASCKEALLKSTRFSEKKSDTFLTEWFIYIYEREINKWNLILLVALFTIVKYLKTWSWGEYLCPR